MNTYLTDIIGDTYKSWERGDSIILSSGTGTGKTTFCKTRLLHYATQQNEKILYICNRITLEENVRSEINEYTSQHPDLEKSIIITKYQDIETKFKFTPSRAKKELETYKYIFLDECHYFTSDAPINPYTELVFKYFKNNKTNILIYASATAPQFFDYLITKYKIPDTHIYRIPTDYSFVENVFIYKSEQLIPMIENIILTEKDSKMIVFCANGNRIMEIYRAFGERFVDVVCSKNYKDKRITEIKNNKAIENKTFKKRILLATSVIDNGIDLEDINIKHIFTEMPTIDSLIQTLGRKRPIDTQDKCNYYIKEYTAKEIKSLKNRIDNQLEMVTMWKTKNEKFKTKFANDKSLLKRSNILYLNIGTDKLSINQMAYAKYKIDQSQYKMMLETSFLDTIINNGIPSQLTTKIKKVDPDDYKDKLLECLKTIEDKKLFKADFEKFQTTLAEELSKIRSIDTRSLGMNFINNILNERYGNKYKKRFTSKKEMTRRLPDGTENPNRFKTYRILQ